jgi:hypothetical protein
MKPAVQVFCILPRKAQGAMAGLGLFDQKSAIAVAMPMPIVTAFKLCIGHRKNGLLIR